ncbi:conserved hypothetical protein (plasmid) [Rhodococcus jostii RHA1]|uniref:Uncharacterized protein n=1 Tax=Rhodococcus jostii (strain RHA1) TaxID=101510 RepID=Q0RV34_RHOJR|nr:conserved hypothetical protein [Rhodococcus jostii RHA1]
MRTDSVTAIARHRLAPVRSVPSGRSADTVYGGHEHRLRRTLIALTPVGERPMFPFAASPPCTSWAVGAGCGGGRSGRDHRGAYSPGRGAEPSLSSSSPSRNLPDAPGRAR